MLHLPKKQVIWGYQKNPKPFPRFARLTITSYREEAREEYRPSGKDGTVLIARPTAGILELQLFGGDGENPADTLENFTLMLARPSFVDLCSAVGVALEADSVQDVPAYVGGGYIPEPRAIVNINFRFMSVVEDDTNIIDTVEINGNVDNKNLDFVVRSDDNGKY